MRIPQDTIDRIRQTVDIIDVVGDYVSLKKRGANWIACCPFHNEKTPSFNVSPARQIYKCFGCGKAGDPVKFVMDIENMSYPEALRHLAKKYGIEVEDQPLTPDELLRQNERDSLFIVLNFAKEFYCQQLHHTEEGRSIGLSYFRERGFLDTTAQTFELGYSLDQWDALLQAALKKGYNPILLEKAGLTLSKENSAKPYDRFRGRVIFPIHNISGRVIAFGARILKTDQVRPSAIQSSASTQPKYINSPETEVYHKSQVLYGIYQAKNAIRQEDTCYLTEGYTDVISLHQAGIRNVVASSGTSLTLEQIRLISRFTQHIIILYDGDVAGIKAALRGLDMVLEEGLNVNIVTFPDGDDPDSYMRKVGAETFKDYLKHHTTDFISFKTTILLKDAGENPFKRAEVISEIVQSISRIPDPIKRQVFFQKTAHQLQIDEQTLLSESNRLVLKQREQKQRQRVTNQDRRPNINANGLQQPGTLSELGQLLNSPSSEPSPSSPAIISDAVNSEPNQKSTRTPLSYHEEECLRLLINYGDYELEPDISLCHYMLSELETIKFETFLFEQMLNEIREGFLANEIRTADYFLHHSNLEYLETTIHLVTSPHQISENWEKHEITVPSEEEKLADAAFTNVLRIKKTIAEQQMSEVKARLSQTSDSKESDQLMKEYLHYKKTDIEIARLLGTVISG